MTSAPDPVPSLAADTVIDLERQYLLQNYSRYPLVVHRGKGCHVYDVNGTRYLDFIAGIGVNALGHAHPRIVKVIREQAALLIHSSNLYYHEYQGPLAKKLAETSGLQRTFFTNSGSEAMEGALKMIRSHGNKHGTGKHEIISLENSFHGRTLGALSITGQPKYRQDFEPLLPGVRFVPANDVAALEAAFSESTAGMVLELIQAEGARTGRPLQRLAGVRRDPMRRRPSRHVFRISAQQAGGAAGYHSGGQTAGMRPPTGSHRGQRKSRRYHRAGHARLHLRRQRAGLPRGARILRHSGRVAIRRA